MRKKCIICEQELLVRGTGRSGEKIRKPLRRSAKAVTCSKDCARVYTNVYNRIKAHVRKDNLMDALWESDKLWENK